VHRDEKTNVSEFHEGRIDEREYQDRPLELVDKPFHITARIAETISVKQ